MTQVDIGQLRDIAEVEFSDIVSEAISPDINELRIILHDGSFVDVWFSLKLLGRYIIPTVENCAFCRLKKGNFQPSAV